MSRKKSRASSGHPISNQSQSNSYKSIYPVAMNSEQKEVIQSIEENQVTIVTGAPGTGKSFIATLIGLHQVLSGKYEKLIFCRPCVEAYGESLGFLPGNVQEKISVYLNPVVEIMKEKVTPDFIQTLMKSGEIQIIPLAFMRGYTFRNAFVIGEEFQNTNKEQMRLFLTRIGEKSKAVITGDLLQSDLGLRNGLSDAVSRLQDVEGLKVCNLSIQSIVRSKIVADIESKYREDLEQEIKDY
jgi:phosphate starvation-inducible PhoH-like protein